MKRFLAILLILTLLPIPMGFAQGQELPRLITDADYAAVDALWDTLELAEAAELHCRTAETSDTAAVQATTAAAVAEAVVTHPLYLEGTLQWNGPEQFTFETTVGVTCGYSVYLRNLTKDSAPAQTVSQTRSFAKRSTAESTEVCLIEPYYGSDMSFTDQYQTEASTLAETLGGTYTLVTGSEATVDAVADAIERGGVVFFDSHGVTDYERGSDCVSGATTSYLCLTTGEGLTTQDYASDNGTYHAVNYSGAYCVDGTAIANHMETSAPGSFLWSAICFGMATDGLHAPLREKGVAVVYGYSQAVTFDYDYDWEAVFFREMREGAYVSDAIAAMKSEVGQWDACDYYQTLTSARANRCAFPIVVSDEDVYPGKGQVDGLQTVYSVWTLPMEGIKHYSVTAASNDETLGTVSAVGNLVTATASEGALISGWALTPADAATVTQEGSLFRLSNVTADCLLTVNFSAKLRATVHYSVPDGCAKEDSYGYVGEKLSLSKPSGTPTADAQSYSFIGWSEAPVEDEIKAPTYYKSSYIPMQEETTLYALYQYYGSDLKAHYTTKLQYKPQYTVSASSNDETLGTVALEGAVVTASPLEGAYVAGFALTPEDAATVTQEDNRFLLSDVTADCHLTVYFAAKTPAVVHYSVPEGCKKADSYGYVGDALALTSPDGVPSADAHSYSFAGWSLAPVEDSANISEYLTETFVPVQAETTLYALYSYEAGGARYYTTQPQNHICYLERYTDTDADMWYHTAVDFVVGNGYMNGVAAGQFDPNGKLTRAMLATILYRLSGETGGSHPFTDVKPGVWYDAAVAWAYESGVVNGTSLTTFSPDAPVTREQAAAMLYRYARHRGEDVSLNGDLSVFRDAGECSAYALAPLSWAVGRKILNGKGNALLDPKGTATRAEIAQILFNLDCE